MKMGKEDDIKVERLMREGARFEEITIEQVFTLCYTYGLEAIVDGDAQKVFFVPLKEKTMNESNESVGILLRCKKCGHRWTYRGKNPYYATCPYCHTLVKIGQGVAKSNLEEAERFKADLLRLEEFLDSEKGKEQATSLREASGVDIVQLAREFLRLMEES